MSLVQPIVSSCLPHSRQILLASFYLDSCLYIMRKYSWWILFVETCGQDCTDGCSLRSTEEFCKNQTTDLDVYQQMKKEFINTILKLATSSLTQKPISCWLKILPTSTQILWSKNWRKSKTLVPYQSWSTRDSTLPHAWSQGSMACLKSTSPMLLFDQ